MDNIQKVLNNKLMMYLFNALQYRLGNGIGEFVQLLLRPSFLYDAQRNELVLVIGIKISSNVTRRGCVQ